MPRWIVSLVVVFLASLSAAGPAAAGPMTREEAERRDAAIAKLKQSITAEPSAAERAAMVERALAAEPVADVRRRVLDLTAAEVPGPEREALLIKVLAGDADAGVRGAAATALGREGSPNALAALAHAAATDPTTELIMGDIGGQSSARRQATFAIAELATRHAALADEAAAKLRALPDKDDPADNQSLADARAQALYQITRDDALLEPFRKRLKSDVPRDRERGVVAYRFLKLTEAPPEVTAALKDADAGVRSWALLVLGEIGDPKTAAPLMAVAADAKADTRMRLGAISALGQMRAADAAGLMEKLLADEDPRVPVSAAIALYRITGKKTPQFPAGYNAD